MTHELFTQPSNDPDASIVCTGIMVRITDDHPGLLPESQWWFNAHLCDRSQCCMLSIPLESLRQQRRAGHSCRIIYD